MRELKQESSELELGLELELESDDVDAAVAAVAAASEGQIPCSCCDELWENAEQLHSHQIKCHTISELSLALITLRGIDIPLESSPFQLDESLVHEDSSHLRDILLDSVNRSYECDSESTITVRSGTALSPLKSPFSSEDYYHSSVFSWNDELVPPKYSPNPSDKTGGNREYDPGLHSNSANLSGSHSINKSSESVPRKSPCLGQRKANEHDDLGTAMNQRKTKKEYSNLHTTTGQKNTKKEYKDLDTRQFLCHLCERRYKKKSHLERHLRVHSGVRPYACQLCEKRFAVRSILKQHIRVHTGEKPFSCEICSQRFPQKSGLMTHMMLHNGKPFKCEYCVKSFVSNHKLMLHQRCHGDLVKGAPRQGPYCCSNCDMHFFTTGALAEHAKAHSQSSIINGNNDEVTISEEAAREAVSAVGGSQEKEELSVQSCGFLESPNDHFDFEDYYTPLQDDLIQIVKEEIFEDEEMDGDAGFLCEARWGGIEDMCI